MRCISPLTLRISGKRVVVPCNKCNYCLETKRADWSFRLSQELKKASSALFLTLTYEDTQLPINSVGLPELNMRHVQLFKKRLRFECSPFTKSSLRYYTVGEYGTKTMRPHYHSIIFNIPPAKFDSIERIWSHGNVHRGSVTPASIHYVTKYVINRMDHNSEVCPVMAMCNFREPP